MKLRIVLFLFGIQTLLFATAFARDSHGGHRYRQSPSANVWRYCTLGSLTNCDISRITNLSSFLQEQERVREPIDGWNVRHVTQMQNMFMGATHFNQPIGNWDVSRVRDMRSMFANVVNFNQDLSQWCVVRMKTKPIGFDDNTPLWEEKISLNGELALEVSIRGKE